MVSTYDTDGNVLWQNILGATNTVYLKTLKYFNDKLVCTGKISGLVYFTPQIVQQSQSDDGYVVMYDSNGAKVFDKIFTGNNNDICLDFDYDSNNNFYILGNSSSPVLNVDNFSSPTFGSINLFITKLSPWAVGVEEHIVNNKKLEVYPNPANGIVYIKLTSNQYQQILLYNTSGELILKRKIARGNSAAYLNLNVETLASGTYYLKFVGDKENFYKKLVIE